MTDVTIPQDVAKAIASFIRSTVGPESSWLNEADLLDPPAQTLRELVAAQIWPGWSGEWHVDQLDVADAVLAVVADWLAAQPLDDEHSLDTGAQRDEDVRLIRGES